MNTDPGQPGAIVTWEEPQAADDMNTPTITVTHESGSLFPIGITMISLTAVDSVGLTANFVFYITVIGKLSFLHLAWAYVGQCIRNLSHKFKPHCN